MNQSDLWGRSRRARLKSARALTGEELSQIHGRLRKELPHGEPAHGWPYGSATSINPIVVILGVSPGDSPAPGDLDHGTGKPFPLPTAGKQHPRFEYSDTGGFWRKIRTLGRTILDHDDTMGDGALALCGTLNLSTDTSGKAHKAAVEPDFCRWVLETIRDGLRPLVLIRLGMRTTISPAAKRTFREMFPGFHENRHHRIYRFRANPGNDNRWFREWNSETKAGPLLIVDWPQHPAWPPFGKSKDEVWFQACREFVEQNSGMIL